MRRLDTVDWKLARKLFGFNALISLSPLLRDAGSSRLAH
jgi:hypothetical protein